MMIHFNIAYSQICETRNLISARFDLFEAMNQFWPIQVLLQTLPVTTYA